jgi:hypothetical protein
MITETSLIESVEPIAILWLMAVAGLATLALRASNNRRRRREPRHPEDGVDYTINLIATFPLLMFLVCLVLETTLILATKIGTVYAAYSAARSALVWEVHGPDEAARKAGRAAVLAMAPFSRGLGPYPIRPGDAVRDSARAYVDLYRRAIDGPVQPSFLANQYVRADGATSVELDGLTDNRPRLSATLRYRYPLRFGIIGFLIARRDPATGERTWPITTVISLQRQEVLDGKRPLGIPYRSED